MQKILVIEDTKLLIKAWVKKFEGQGFEVLTANDGTSAIEAAIDGHPDLVVVDLPETQGAAAIKKLREFKWANRIPVMFLNSWHDPEVFREYSVGLDEHLDYNWSLEEVTQRAKQKLATT